MKQIRVLIIEVHSAVRRALAARLGSFPNIEVVAKAGTFQEGLKLAETLRPDVILLELKGAGRYRVNPVSEMVKKLAGNQTGIIVLTSYADGDERDAALGSGASRYLLKQIDTSRLLAEIEAVASEAAGQIG